MENSRKDGGQGEHLSRQVGQVPQDKDEAGFDDLDVFSASGQKWGEQAEHKAKQGTSKCHHEEGNCGGTRVSLSNTTKDWTEQFYPEPCRCLKCLTYSFNDLSRVDFSSSKCHERIEHVEEHLRDRNPTNERRVDDRAWGSRWMVHL